MQSKCKSKRVNRFQCCLSCVLSENIFLTHFYLRFNETIGTMFGEEGIGKREKEKGERQMSGRTDEEIKL